MLADYKNKKILITGGLGFLGSNLAIKLVELGAEVELYDSLEKDQGGNLFNIKPIRQQVKITKAKLQNARQLKKAVKDKDIIFNIAGHSSHLDSIKDPWVDVETNIIGQLTLLEACRQANPKVKIVYAATRAQYGKLQTVPVKEDHPLNPLDIYAVNKISAEQYHFIYQKICDLRVVSLRLNNTYGPRHQMKHTKYGVQNYFIRLALDNEEIKIYGSGEQLRDFNYIDDVIEAFLLTGINPRADSQIYNLGSGAPISLLDFVKKVIELAGSGSFQLVPWSAERKQIEVGDYVADFNKIKQELGWQPQVSLDEGLKMTIDFYKENKKYYWD